MFNGIINNNVNLGGAQTITGEKTLTSKLYGTAATFSATVRAGASEVDGAAVVTSAKSKSANGYYKLGNGLIIQWASNNASSGGTTWTFPTPFTSTYYKVSIVPQSYHSDRTRNELAVTSKTTTNCKLFMYDTTSCDAIAIGF